MRLNRFFAAWIIVCALLTAFAGRAAEARDLAYPEALDLAVAAMEEGKHIQSLGPLRTALSEERNEPCGVLALGILYLHSGSPVRAAREFQRAHELDPTEPLAVWGAALAALAQNHRDPAAFDALSASDVPAAPDLAAYVRLLNGQASFVRDATKDVTATEPDPLRLEIAAFAALRGGDPARGEALLNALVARPDMKTLSEDRALSLLFLSDQPAQGQAPMLPTAIGFPGPAGGAPLSGDVTLNPPSGLPSGVSYVTYSTEGGGGFSATTNNAPFLSTWNTTRFPNGLYTLRTVAYDANRRVISDTSRTVAVSNADAAPSHALSDDQRRDMRQRLAVLLTPRVSRKAAHFALAEQAMLRSDENAALDHLEAVVAIDPLFNGAHSYLRRYRTQAPRGGIGYWRGVTSEKIVALTFDDGPNPLLPRTPALLNALKKEDIKATFFVVGARAEQCTDLLRRMTDEGHEVADHSYSHPNLTFLDNAAVERELCRTSVIIREATGKRPRFYRPPGGNYNTTVVSAAEALGMSGAYWTIDGVRFESPPFTAPKLTQFVLSQVRPGAIILLHNAPENTINALPAIVAGLRARGYEMVTMSELARRAAPGGPHTTVAVARKPGAPAE